MKTTGSRLAWVALLVFACALLALGAQLPGYSHWLHPVPLPGARGLPGATLFNAMVFVVPGLLMGACALWLRGTLPEHQGLAARLGMSLLLLAALAFAAQGLLPLDAGDLDGPASGLHAAAWTTWWIAFAAGASLLAVSLPPWRLPMLPALAVVLACAPLAGVLLPGALAQRLACVVWFVAVAWAASRPVSRGAA